MPAGPTPPVMSTMGAPVEGRLSLVGSRCCSVAMVSSFLRKQQVNQPSISSHAKAGLNRGDLGSRALAPQGIYLASQQKRKTRIQILGGCSITHPGCAFLRAGGAMVGTNVRLRKRGDQRSGGVCVCQGLPEASQPNRVQSSLPRCCRSRLRESTARKPQSSKQYTMTRTIG